MKQQSVGRPENYPNSELNPFCCFARTPLLMRLTRLGIVPTTYHTEANTSAVTPLRY